ncbi:hypothetical protein [Rhodococcus globerulus]|uniref:Uncharacterized protein n=1 Tax=Rhodococcus globerulus TaxID=33008 RepID=A0ABU4C5B1_RHOGO|nr:hypothetical protein [Rhodococcus globerulus]MDV6271605.1 hypothetical protein [Rhodococcus globerulus]
MSTPQRLILGLPRYARAWVHLISAFFTLATASTWSRVSALDCDGINRDTSVDEDHLPLH